MMLRYSEDNCKGLVKEETQYHISSNQNKNIAGLMFFITKLKIEEVVEVSLTVLTPWHFFSPWTKRATGFPLPNKYHISNHENKYLMGLIYFKSLES